MLPSSDAEELRALQSKAYGRGGGLTEAEARRLRELEDARRAIAPTVPEAPAEPEAPAASARHSVPAAPIETITEVPTAAPTEPEAAARPHPDPGIPAESARPARRAPFRDSVRGRAAILTAVCAALLGIGLAAGWALFGDRSTAPVLTADEEQRRVELVDTGDFDEGSLRPVARDEDALAWYATQGRGEKVCLVLDVDGQSTQQCRERDAQSSRGPWVGLMVPGEEDPGAGTGASAVVSINAVLLFATTGEPMVAIERWTSTGTMVSQFPTEHRERATELLDEGFDAGLSLVGRFQERPVWLGTRLTDDQTTVEQCLIVDGADAATQCTRDLEASGILVEAGGEQAGLPASWTLELQSLPGQMPYLTITALGPSAVTESETVKVGGEHGDPIEVRTPGDGSG